jgi:hypothetical protein
VHDKMKNYIDEVKTKIGTCADCGLFCEDWNVMMFAFDHLDPTTKSFALSKATQQKNCRQELIDAEIAKCELVCHNCHAYRTWAERAHLGKGKKREEYLPLVHLMYASD